MLNIKCKIPEAWDAFDDLYWTVYQFDWFEKNGRLWAKKFFSDLNNPLINEMLKDAHLINPNDSRDSKFTEKYSKRFEQELYLPDEYIERVQRAELSLLAIEKCWYKVEELNKNWYFKICNEYFVIPHLYRAWSSYYFCDNGTGCVYLCNSEKRPEYLPHQTAVILHEILHLGIEELIVQKFNLCQEEKERLVDNLCMYVTDDNQDFKYAYKWSDCTTSPHQETTRDYAYMDALMGIQPETNLVKAVEKFVANRASN